MELVDKFFVVKYEVLREIIQTQPELADGLGKLVQAIHSTSTPHRYLVCNRDEPYADKVWDTIRRGEKEKQCLK